MSNTSSQVLGVGKQILGKQFKELSSKEIMPSIGFGTWKTKDTSLLVQNAIKIGYRHIDTACDYGNEKEVGEGIRNAIKNYNLNRKDIFVTSKLWNTYHSKDHVKLACQRSLNDLGLEYLDLYLVHFPLSVGYVEISEQYPPEGYKVNSNLNFISIHETWKAMESLVDQGLVKSIGISNFNVQMILELLSGARIKPAVLQIEYHPYFQQKRLYEFCERFNIVVTAYSPFASLSYQNDSEEIRNMKSVFDQPIIVELASKYSVSPAQIVLNWLISEGLTTVPKSSNEERMSQNLNIWNFQLDAQEIQNIRKLNMNRRFCDTLDWTGVPLFD